MRILIENNIQSINADHLTSYSSTPLHGAGNMLDDYPTVQWVAGFPEVIETDTTTGRLKISSSLTAEGVGSMNGIYLGNFNGDSLTYEISELDTTGVFQSIGSAADVPVMVYNSFGHFVRGIPSQYDDYLYTLEDLGFSRLYVYTGFQIGVTVSSSINNLTDLGQVNFKTETVSKLSYTDTLGRRYWKLKGTFTNISESNIPTSSNYFARDAEVGMVIQVEVSNSSGVGTLRYAQICEVRGNGSKSKSVCLLIRSFETVDSNGDPVEEDLEDWVNLTTTVPVEDTDINFSNTIIIRYLFNSIRIGLMRAGYIEQFPNPQTGMTRTYKDYSKKTETLDGGHHAVNRNIAKVYNGRLIMDRDRVRRFLTFAEHQRVKPFPVEILSEMVEETPTVFYGFFSSTPNESLNYRTGIVRDLDFSIQQVF